MQYLQKGIYRINIIKEYISHIQGQRIHPVWVEMWCLVKVLHDRN